MTLLEAIVLGIVQGLSEFLPISSTAHMTLVGRALGSVQQFDPAQWTAFIAVVQLGTLAAVLVYFYEDLMSVLKKWTSENLRRVPFREQSQPARLGWYIILSTIPIAVIGLLARDFIESAFTKNLYVIAGSLIALGLILELAERVGTFKRSVEEVTVRDALIIGLAQVMALIPGSSRSGTTITAGLFVGLRRDSAARFSFLMSVPAIGASGLLELFAVVEDIDKVGLVAVVAATLAAGVSGYLCIALLLNYLKRQTTRVFVVYRVLLGLTILVALWTSTIEP